MSGTDERELRLRTIKGVRELMQSAGTFHPDAAAIVPHSNGYSMWFVAYDPQPLGTAPISDEEILRRIESREGLQANRGRRSAPRPRDTKIASSSHHGAADLDDAVLKENVLRLARSHRATYTGEACAVSLSLLATVLERARIELTVDERLELL